MINNSIITLQFSCNIFIRILEHEDLAKQVAEKLLVDQENRFSHQKQIENDEEIARKKEEENKKRWAALRGSPNKHENYETQQKPLSSAGRGRGRGMLNNLRRPGEKTNPTPNDSQQFIQTASSGNASFGRGTKLHSNMASNNEETQRWAGASIPPNAKEAPRPPRAWMT